MPFDVVHIAYSPFPSDPRVRREVLALANAGYSVAVIALASDQPPGESTWNGVTVLRLDGSKRRGTLGQYVIEYGSFLVRSWRMIRSDPRLRDARVVHAHSLPDFLIFAAQPARRRGAKLILDLHEIFPEFAATKFAGAFSKPARLVALLLERTARGFADATITVNTPIEHLLGSRRPRADERLTVLHNAPDPADFGPPREPVITEHPRPLRVVYHGTLTRVYGLDMAIDAVQRLTADGHRVTLDIFGDGPDHHLLRKKIDELNLRDCIQLHQPVSAAVLRARLPTFDAGLVPTRADTMTQYSLSTKLLEYVQLGIPAIAPTLMTYQRYFRNDELHYYVANDTHSLAETLLRVQRTPAATLVTGAKRAQQSLDAISWEREKPRLLALYETLLA